MEAPAVASQLYCICWGGLDKPTEGAVIIGQKNITDLGDKELTVFRRNHIGFVFQNYNLVPVLSVLDNILLPSRLAKMKIDKGYVDNMIGVLGLKEKLKSFPNQLSGGQQQRVAIARALIMKPEVILADEPTGNLDSRNGNEVLELFQKSIKDIGQTLIMITHNDKIAQMAERCIQLEDGRIVRS